MPRSSGSFGSPPYFKLRRGHHITLADICENVPGYEAHFDLEGNLVKDAMWEAVRKSIRRDLALLADVFGIRIEYDDKTQMYQLLPPFLTSEERDVLVAAAALVRVDGLNDEQLTALGAAVDADGQRIIVRVHRHLLALRAGARRADPRAVPVPRDGAPVRAVGGRLVARPLVHRRVRPAGRRATHLPA